MVDKEAIIRHLQHETQRPAKPKEIARALRIGTRDYAALKQTLRELEDSGRVYRVRGGRYAAPGRINLTVGRLQVTRGGHGFVVPDEAENDVFIPASRLGNAYAGDRVAARIERVRPGRSPEGSIARVLERAREQVVGVYHRSGPYGYLVPGEGSLHRDVFVPAADRGNAENGDVVVVRIVDWGSDHHDPVGEVIEVLGRPGEPGVDVLAIVHTHQLSADFPAAVQAEAEKLGRRRLTELNLSERVDLRDKLTFTIDPADAKDHDDAVSIEPLAKDRWRVGVHIADVSHFFAGDSPIDEEAFRRGTSVYLVDRTIPMLPEVLSGDLCSLKADQDRLTLSLLIDMNGEAEVLGTALEPSIIRSRFALSYEGAQDILDGKRKAKAELRSALRGLRDLSKKLRSRRQARGSLDFDLPEARVIVNAAGEPTEIQKLLRLDTHQLIEEFMILANERVARLAKRKKLPFVYRVHEAPDPERLERLSEFVSGLGLKLAKNAYRSPRALQKLLATVEGRPEESVVSTLTLRSMKQARYSAEAKEHFGLASRAYTHFTSPIRRYPDLVVHRIVRAALIEDKPVADELAANLSQIAIHASTRERQAEEAERESVELKRMEYMERHLGDVFNSTVSGVRPFGLFVLLDEVLAEGLVHVSQLEDDYYQYVEDEYSLVGEARGRRFRLGDRLSVQVMSVNRESRELNLALAQ